MHRLLFTPRRNVAADSELYVPVVAEVGWSVSALDAYNLAARESSEEATRFMRTFFNSVARKQFEMQAFERKE